MKALRLMVLVASGLSGTGLAQANCAAEFQLLSERFRAGGDGRDLIDGRGDVDRPAAKTPAAGPVDEAHDEARTGPTRPVETILILGRMAIAKGDGPGCRAALEDLRTVSSPGPP